MFRCPLAVSEVSRNLGGLKRCALTGDAAVGKSSLLVRLTDQRFLANPDPTVCLVLHLIKKRALSKCFCSISVVVYRPVTGM